MRALLRAPLAFLRLFYQSVYLSLDQIWANKTRAMLTVIGIVIGVAAVTAVTATLTGLKTEVLKMVEEFGTNTVVVMPKRAEEGRKRNASWWTIRFLPEHFDGMLEHCPSVARISRLAWVERRTVRHADESVESVKIIGVEPSYHEIVKRPMVLGRKLSVIDDMQVRPVCLIDSKLHYKLQLDRDCIGQSILIGHVKFVVVGVMEWRPPMEPGQASEDHYEIFVPFRTAFKLQGEPFIMAFAASKSTDMVEDAQAEIRFFLRRTRNIKPTEPDTFEVSSVKRYVEMFNTIALILTLVAVGVVSISLLVGGVGVMNIMLVSVSERTREIGLRKAVGAKKSAILSQFLIESVVLCFVGGLVGIGFGQLLTMALVHIPKYLSEEFNMPMVYIPVWAIILSFGFTASIGIFFGMFPAIKAARLDPIEALRHE
ncbi:MAG TPA: ABC transporter permease [Sedimentisphaerales bacterium]|nr:ABC transporter permease [Sedimentisphaerales bacterium]